MKLVFCGTPQFAVPVLEALLQAEHEIALVLTQPDRPVGRKQELQAPAVKLAAGERGLEVLQPEKIKNNEALRARLEEIQPDAIIVVAYGRIIAGWMLELPRFGNLNLHGSLLPKYRGAAPIQWAVANGEAETGVTTMRLDAGLDTGDVLLEARMPIAADAMAADLYAPLARIGAKLMVETLAGLEQGTLSARPQDHSRATLAPILTREDGRMDLARRTAREVYNRWRAFAPWPGAYAEFRGKRFLVHRMRLAKGEEGLKAGELVVIADELRVAATDGAQIVLDEVQMEGKSRMSGAAFARDFQLKRGESLA